MKSKISTSSLFIFIAAAVAIGGFIYWLVVRNNFPPVPADQTTPEQYIENDKTTPAKEAIILPEESKPETVGIDLINPLDRPAERIVWKKFGTYIDPSSSPVQPERFQGWHTGVDWEVFPEEIDQAVMVKAVCSGRVLIREYIQGYGGVMVTSCMVDEQPITVLYGHLKLDSIAWKEWDQINAGDVIGQLGAAYSNETDGERKHLHLSWHRGEAVNYLGYVADPAQLNNWIDPCEKICGD